MSQPSLLRQLGLFSATAIVVSNMIGTGVFTMTGFIAGNFTSPVWVVGVWFIGALLALAGAICYSELGINFPRSGGEYVYLTEAFGPMWGFLTGWVSFFAGFSAPIAAGALAIVEYLGYFFPGLAPQAGAPSTPGLAVACVIVLTFTTLNVVGLLAVARIQNILTTIKVLVIVAFIAAGVAAGRGDWGHLTASPAPPADARALPIQILLSLVLVYFSYSGWNAATYVAEEIREPRRTLPRALLIGTAMVALIYGALNLVFVYALPLDSMKGVVRVGAQAAQALFGPAVAGAFSGLMAFSLLSTVNAMTIIGPRVYYAMAADGAFFRVAQRVHPRFRTPWFAILAQGLCCCLMIVFGTFRSLVTYVGFTLWLFTMMAVIGLFRLRRRPEWQQMPAVNFLFPMIPAVYVAASGWALVNAVLYQPKESGYGFLTMILGALFYQWRRSAK
jgi:APA family basic amino acid/polyamine antiporter